MCMLFVEYLHIDNEHPVSKLDLVELELIECRHISLVSIAFDNHAISRREIHLRKIFSLCLVQHILLVTKH